MPETQFTVNKITAPAIWTDKVGVTHQAVGARMISIDPDTFVMWTACGRHDIPANSAFLGSPADVTCGACREAGLLDDGGKDE